MTETETVTSAERKRIIARSLVRLVATTTLMVVLYYVLPFGRLPGALSVVLLCGGLVGAVVVLASEIRAIMVADFPGARAIEVLVLFITLFLLLFSSGYYLLEHANAAAFSQRLSRTDALYFTLTTFATVGYGDITPQTETARAVVMVQMLLDLLIVGIGAKVIVGAVQIGKERRQRNSH